MCTAEIPVSATAALLEYMNIYVYVLACSGLKKYNTNIQLIFLCFSSVLCIFFPLAFSLCVFRFSFPLFSSIHLREMNH